MALERVTGIKLNDYLQTRVFKPLAVEDMSMVPNRSMRQRLAYMNSRDADGTLRGRDHLLRAPLVVDLSSDAEIARVFNSGGAGMFAKPQEYCSE